MEGQTRLLRLEEVKERVGIGRSQIYKLMQDGRFPRCIKVGGRASAWVAAEVDDWITKCIEDSRA